MKVKEDLVLVRMNGKSHFKFFLTEFDTKDEGGPNSRPNVCREPFVRFFCRILRQRMKEDQVLAPMSMTGFLSVFSGGI